MSKEYKTCRVDPRTLQNGTQTFEHKSLLMKAILRV